METVGDDWEHIWGAPIIWEHPRCAPFIWIKTALFFLKLSIIMDKNRSRKIKR